MSSRRGSYRGFDRGRGRHWSGGADNNQAEPRQNPLPPEPLGSVIDSINIKTLLTEEDAPKINKVKFVASYNWVNGDSPVVLVPGCPPAWTPPTTDVQLKADSEDVFRDINAARYASYPLEPMFRSLQAMQEDYDLQAVDIVGCGSTIGNLLRFARSESRPFRFDLDVIGDTVLCVRKESSPKELITNLRGYGHTFPEAYTTWDPEARNSCSHQRIIQYEFGGVEFLIRTETDGYVKDSGAKAPVSIIHGTSQLPLDNVVESLAVSSNKAPHEQQQPLQIKLQGMKVRQDQIFDIKTRATYKPFDMDEILPRLWLNQTSNFVIAYHKSGLFDQPKVMDIGQRIIEWEKNNSHVLARFHALVRRIMDVVRDSDHQQCEVSWDGQGPLYITKQIGEGRKALPSELIKLYDV